MKKIDTVHGVPDKLSAFESYYDDHTGGWRFPAWVFDNTLKVELFEAGTHQYDISYAPVEREVALFYDAWCNCSALKLSSKQAQMSGIQPLASLMGYKAIQKPG